MSSTNEWIDKMNRFGAHNYDPLPIAAVRAEGVWIEDAEGRRYMDMLSAYSAASHGHRHPDIVRALKEQADRLTLTSRAIYSDKLSEMCEAIALFAGKERVLPMNTGAEAVETAVKAARRWVYDVKGVAEGLAEIVVCEGNFHGRTVTVTSFSSEANYRRAFGPYTPGFRLVPYGDAVALERAITSNTAAFLVEPIQGEGGIVIPPAGYLREAAGICRKHNVLLIADEIQTGFGRTGRKFACDWEQVTPDIYILGKALGGGIMPVSAIAADCEVMDVFEPGSHGSTFGGSPLAGAVALAALDVYERERLAERSLKLGGLLLERLGRIRSPHIRELRGRGLFIGIELSVPARPYCEKLLELGLLCKETHERVIRLAPPLTITEQELDWALEKLTAVLHTENGEADRHDSLPS